MQGAAGRHECTAPQSGVAVTQWWHTPARSSCVGNLLADLFQRRAGQEEGGQDVACAVLAAEVMILCLHNQQQV
jgi:hypothetical protein